MIERAIVGVDLGGTNLRVGRVRRRQLEARHSRRLFARQPRDQVLEQVLRSIDRVFDENVVGIGCGVPGLVDVERGIVYGVENIPSWREIHLKDELQRRYAVPVCINNDANAFALGELYFGKGRGYRDMVGLTLGTGLGAGVIIGGRLYCGGNCGAGEIGPIPHRAHTIEHYCAGRFFRSRTGESGRAMFERARQGDERALRVFEAFGAELGHAVMVVLYAYDPALLVFGGSISQAFSFFEGGLRERLRDYRYQHALERLVITRSEIEDVAILGAAALCLDAEGRAGSREDSRL